MKEASIGSNGSDDLASCAVGAIKSQIYAAIAEIEKISVPEVKPEWFPSYIFNTEFHVDYGVDFDVFENSGRFQHDAGQFRFTGDGDYPGITMEHLNKMLAASRKKRLQVFNLKFTYCKKRKLVTPHSRFPLIGDRNEKDSSRRPRVSR